MGGGDVVAPGSKRALAPPPTYPPPKRRAVSAKRHFPPGCGRDAATPLGPRNRVPGADGDCGAPAGKMGAPLLAGIKGCVPLEAASPTSAAAAAAATSALKKASAADGAVPEERVVNSSEAMRQSVVAAAGDLPDATSHQVPDYTMADRGRGAGNAELWRTELVPGARFLPRPRMVSAERRFPPGCGRGAPASLLGGGSSELRLQVEAGPADGGFGAPERLMATDAASSAANRHVMESVAAPCRFAIGGAVMQDQELEEGEIAPEENPESQVITDVTLLDSEAGRHGASVLANDVETSAVQSGEKRPSLVVAKDTSSGESSDNVATESLAQGHSKEIDRMNMAPSNVSAGVFGEGTVMRSKLIHTPRKTVKPSNTIKIAAPNTQHLSFSKDKNKEKEKEAEFERGVLANGIEETGELTTHLVKQAFMSPNKQPFGPRKKVKVKNPAHVLMKASSTCMDDKMASKLEGDDLLKALAVYEGKLELYINNSSDVSSMICQRQYRVQNSDARSKFKMWCRRFEFLCRTLVQAVEQRLLSTRRIDLEVAKVIKNLPDFIKPDPIVGSVPGVEVGDEFLYRVQLALVGLHHAYQGGIDTTKYRNGMRIAISIVCSGGYPDELSCSGELIYTGSGGKRAGKKDDEDQKLERGNLALKNCIKTKTPVRVIHGFKDQNTEGGSHSRAKQVSTFTYDGLYRVVDIYMEGEPGSRVFKYKLIRIPGQPELPLQIAKQMRKSKIRPGLCIADISQGKEETPMCVINTVDDARPTPFRYITRMKNQFWPTETRPQSCDCTSGCSDSANCACAMKNGGKIPFNFNGALVHDKPLIFECGTFCTCPPSCHNRVSQHGINLPLEVFRTTKTGWGVRSLTSIPSGSFICEYVGKLLHRKEADQRRNNDYLFEISPKHDDENSCKVLQSQSTASDLNSSGLCSQTMEYVGFAIDAAECGNVGRFINHGCSPNLYAQKVLWDHEDKRMPHIMFFAAETIPPLQELTYDYSYEIDRVPDANGRIKFKNCHCGSPQCRGWLY